MCELIQGFKISFEKWASHPERLSKYTKYDIDTYIRVARVTRMTRTSLSRPPA
jgi:hypothetical protein